MIDVVTGSRIEVRRTGDAVYVFVPAAQLEAVREVLRLESVAFEMAALRDDAVVLTLIGGDADARRAQDALDRAA